MLLTGRNTAPLSDHEIKRVANVFLGLDRNVNVRYEENCRTVFRVSFDEQTGIEYGEIVFGPDIYLGATSSILIPPLRWMRQRRTSSLTSTDGKIKPP